MDQHTNVDVLQLRAEEKEVHLQQSQDHEVELCQTLRLQVEDLQKRLEEKDNKLAQANKVIRALRDEVQTLQQQLEQHRRKYRDDTIGLRRQQCRCGREDGITLGRGIPPNALLSCTTEDDPEDVPMSPQEVEGDPVPTPPSDDTLTSSAGVEDEPADMSLILGDGTLIRVKSLQQLKRLQDHRDMLEPDRVIKMESEEGDEDDDGDEDNGDDPCYQDNEDDSDYDPKSDGFYFRSEKQEVLSPPEEGIAEPEEEQRRQSRGGERLSTDSPHENTFIASANNGNDQTVDKISMQSGDLLQHPALGKRPPRKLLPGKPGRCMEGTFLSHKKVHTEVTSYACTHCGKTFKRMCSLRRHIRCHTGERPYACTQCDKTFRYRSSFHSHKKVHTEGRSYACTQCDKTFRCRSSFLSHKKVHTEVTSCACTHCGKTFKRMCSLRRHVRCHTGERPYACTQCEKAFKFSSNLQAHQKSCHAQKRPSSTESPNVGSCQEVDQSSTHQDVDKTATPSSDPDQTALTPGKTGRPMKGIQKRKDYVCNVCEKKLSSATSLRDHMRIHSGEKPYQCTQCSKTFTKKENMLTHEKLHTEERPYACTQCDKMFKTKGVLLIHERIHSGEMPYTCTQCGKKFRTNTNLRAHQKTQHPEQTDVDIEREKFPCDVCGKVLSSGPNLQLHKRLHTGAGSQCEVCGMIVPKRSNFLKHMRIHTGERPYACTHCEKTFICAGTLNIHHRRLHSKERPYKCPNCPMEFKIPRDLKRHVTQKHSGEKPFACSLCSKTFHTTSELKNHKKSHLGSDFGRGDNSHAVHFESD